MDGKDTLRQVKDKLNEAIFNGKVPKYLNQQCREMMSAEESTLDLIGFKHGTDKASLIYDEDGLQLSHDYLRHYDFLFDRFRNDEIILLEFGCYRGESLRMWKEYFPKAEIYGVDVDETAAQYEEERIHIIIGDATWVETFDVLKNLFDGRRPFIIIDDASHAWGDQRITFEMFWFMLEPGGFYVIEDLECGSMGAYSKEHPPRVQDSQPFFKYVQSMCSFLRWSPRRRDIISRERDFHDLPLLAKRIQVTLDACYFVPGAIVMKKHPLNPPWE